MTGRPPPSAAPLSRAIRAGGARNDDAFHPTPADTEAPCNISSAWNRADAHNQEIRR